MICVFPFSCKNEHEHFVKGEREQQPSDVRVFLNQGGCHDT